MKQSFRRFAVCVLGNACRAEPALVCFAFKRLVPSVPHYADNHKLRYSCVRSIFDDKRHYAFAARFCISGDQLRSELCTDSTHARKLLVLFIYVAAYRVARRDDFSPHCSKASADCRNKNGTVYTVDTIENDYIVYAACRDLHLWFVCIYFARRMALSRFAGTVLFSRYGKRLCYILYRL